ncbi:MAG TPA: acyltransferase family protein, partial [Gammaproteobacteria bacterium]|nr:acyltransferase family protein [Gammaproteobacteria bacterium]
MNIEKSEVEKVPYLDGLRGIAALMVLFAHLMISLYPAVVTFTPSEIHTRFDVALGISPFSVFWRGNFAVCIFFVISGFVLSEFCQKTTISFPAQLVRRYLRLAIPMLITSAFAWLLLSISAYANYKAAVDVTHSGWLSMWYQFNPHFLKMAYEALYRAFVEGNAIYNSNLWTMRIELLGSAYIFLLHYLFRNKYLRLAIIVYWLMKTPHPSYYLLFAWGAFLYDFKDILLLSLKKIIPNYYGRSILVILGLIIGIYFGGYPEL